MVKNDLFLENFNIFEFFKSLLEGIMDVEGKYPTKDEDLDRLENKISPDLECDDPNLSYLSDFLEKFKTFIELKRFDDGFSNRIANPSKCDYPTTNTTNKAFVQ